MSEERRYEALQRPQLINQVSLVKSLEGRYLWSIHAYLCHFLGNNLRHVFSITNKEHGLHYPIRDRLMGDWVYLRACLL
jgi:hypothetical protein